MIEGKLYQEELMGYFRFPVNRGTVKDCNFCAADSNPSCGDQLAIEGIIKDEKVDVIKFNGSGCVISQATASMLTELCVGKTVDEVLAMDQNTVCQLVKVPLGPNRLRCALLSLSVVQEGLLKFKDEQNK
ncbi:iron-sulfur cluster assembly scaffold protein [bacterium]|nr:iron-sulfur cluster assembly scaffold protein [bacterium]